MTEGSAVSAGRIIDLAVLADGRRAGFGEGERLDVQRGLDARGMERRLHIRRV